MSEPLILSILIGEERDDCPLCIALARGATPSELLDVARNAPLPPGVSVICPEAL